MSAAGERAIAYRHAHQAAICDRSVPWAHGTAVFAGDLAAFYDYNEVRLEGSDLGIALDALVTEADRLQAGLGHRRLSVEDVAAGEHLRPGFEALGWKAERLVWMELAGPAHGTPVAVEITDVPIERTRPLRETWFVASGWMTTPEAARRFMVLEERVAAHTGSRALMAWGAAGEAIGYLTFSVAAGTAEIEQAYVDPQRRGGGIGGALVSAAVAAAGTPTTFIVADDEEDAKRLYERLGFAPVWIQHQFTLRGPGD
jgi:ribosomal protein S18 acetylase RimI-like enzyme